MSLTILGGKFRGRVLKSPKGKTRPTTSLMRKAIFDILQHEIEDAVFIDLFAGSGAVGLEALSRGAKCVYFAESEPRTFSILQENIHLLKCENVGNAYLTRAHSLIKRLEKEYVVADFVYIDPPYNIEISNPSSYFEILKLLEKSPLLKPGSQLFVENDNEKVIIEYLREARSLALIDTRSYSDSYLHRFIKK